MNPALRHQLAQLDRALLALLNERARLAACADAGSGAPAVEDLLRRSPGPVPADGVRAVFEAVGRACAAEAPR